jgi:hypothetical protein
MDSYNNTQVTSQQGGKKTVRKVVIKRGKGYKSVTKYHKGKKIKSYKKPIKKSHIKMILIGKFIPGLFSDCKCKKTRKNK